MSAALFAILIVAKLDDVKVVMFDGRLPCPKTSDTIFLHVHMFLFVSKETREHKGGWSSIMHGRQRYICIAILLVRRHGILSM
jgi:hypothetical protein